jgi:hypothetical protein
MKFNIFKNERVSAMQDELFWRSKIAQEIEQFRLASMSSTKNKDREVVVGLIVAERIARGQRP